MPTPEQEAWAMAAFWRPMETAPRDGSEILVCIFGDTRMVVFYDDEAEPAYPWGTLDGPHYSEAAPSHWMPLPDPPKT